MSDERFLQRRRAINRRAAAKSRQRLKEHFNRVKSEYYAAQCANTKLNYDKKQLERKREQLLSQWRMHDAVSCRRSSSSTSTFASGYPSAAVASPPAEILGFPASSPLAELTPVASGSTPVEESGSGAPPFDDDDDDEGDTDDSMDDDELGIFDEWLMTDLAADIYDPLSRSLSAPVAQGADAEYPSLAGFASQIDDPSLYSIFDVLSSSTSTTANVAQRTSLSSDPPYWRPKSSSWRTETRSRSFPLTETRTVSGTIRAGDRTAASLRTSTAITTQSELPNIPLHVRSLSPVSDDDDNN